MNPLIFNFCLMVFWGIIALCLLVIGPLFAPDLLPDTGRNSMLGMGAVMLTAWNLVRFLSMRASRRQHQMEAANYREERNPQAASKEPKPVLHPEFQFDDASQAQPPKQDGK